MDSCSVCWTLFSLLIFCFILTCAAIYFKFTAGKDTSYTCMAGKTVIVTGANNGIGYYTAKEMAKRGARVILACRSNERAEEARRKIIESTNNPNIIIRLVDMSSLKSVRKFAELIKQTETKLDVLINNAGVLGLDDKKTEDGLDQLMQINYFAPFLLTILLLDLLKSSSPSRIVNVASIAARNGRLDPKNLNRYTSKAQIYSNSKLCNILFTKELAKRLIGSGVSVYSVHPGVIKTDIYNHMGAIALFFVNMASTLFFKTLEEGAQTQNYVSAAKGIEELSGKHFVDCKVVEYGTARNDKLAEDVWDETVKLLALTEEEEKCLPVKFSLVTNAV